MMKKLLALCLSLSLLLTPALALKGEVVDPNDLPILPPQSSTWAQAEIMAAQEAGLLVDSLGPDFTVNITREQFAELVIQLVKQARSEIIWGVYPDPAPDTTFSDTTNPAILQAYSMDIVTGVGNNRFDPASATNREQIATFLYRAILYMADTRKSEYLPESADLSGFADKDTVSSWAVEGMGGLAANSIMKGSGNAVLPQDACTIEQSVLLCYRIYTMMTEQ